MRENSSVDGKKKLVNSGVQLILTLVVLLCVLESSIVKGKTEFPKTNADLQATSLCPSACTCSEQKLKLSQGSVEQELNPSNHKETTENLNVHSKIKPEILKSGIKVQCQNPAFIVSVKKLNLQSLLVENIVQYDLSGNSLTRLSGEDFANGNYLMLQKLILKNNQIEEIAADTFSMLKNLKYLDLSNNFLTNFSSATIENVLSLDRVKLNGNPLKCDCHLSGLLTYASSRNIRLQGTCLEPPRLKDRSLTRLVVEELACPPEDPVGVEIRPNTNQLVFEGDPLKLSCKFKAGRAVAPNWLHRNANNQTATVSPGGAVELTTSSRGTDQGTETESQLLIRHLLPRHGGMWACSWGGRTASVEVTVLSLTTPTCSSHVTASNKGRYSWPRTMANLKIALPCQANPNLQAFRLCGALGHWEEPDLNSCFYLSEVTKVLEQFAKTNLTFSKTSALESARRLKSYLTDVISLTDPHEAIFITQTLHNYLEASGKHPELLPIIMDIYSILITQDPQLLADSRHGLVGLLQQAPLKTQEFEYRSSSLVIEKCGIIGKSLSAGTCTWRRTSETGSSKSDSKTKARSPYKASCGQNSNGTGTIEASVRVPLISEGAFSEQSVVLSLVLSTNAFVSTKSKPLATPVLGVTSGPVSNLINRTTPFVMTIRLSRAIGTSDRLVGARWNHYTDQWSPEQCQTLKSSGLMSEGDSVTFQCCCGFGFFAAFTTQDEEDEQNLVEQVTTKSGSGSIPGSAYFPGQLHLLPSPVYVGSVIGLLCHLTACLCYLIHRRRLKMTQPTRHALINTWISVALLMVAFTLGVRPVLGKLPCQIAGLLLHYLTLSSLLWMVVNASSLYKHITKSSRTDPETDSSLMEEAMAVGHDSPPKPALRFYLIGWGIPLIVVGIAGAIHLEQYYGPKICFLAWTPSLGAVGLPSAILILLILTFHLLTWCFLRHTSRLAAIHQKQLTTLAAVEEPGAMAAADAASSGGNKDVGMCGRMQKDKKTCGLQGGYVPLAVDGDVTSCPSNVTNQVTETSDLASLSSDHERIALLIQRGEAEGAMSANESVVLHSGRSESERPLLIVTSSAASSSDDRLEDGAKTDVDDQGHSNPLMASFTDDGDSKKRECASSIAPSVMDPGIQNAIFHLPVQAAIPPAPTEDADEKSTLSQLRGQFVFLILFCLTWLSGLCVVVRPFRSVLPHYDELVSSLCYAIFCAATGLHAVLFHLLTRKDVCASCFDPHTKEHLESIVALPAPCTNSHTDLSSHHNHHHQQQQHHHHRHQQQQHQHQQHHHSQIGQTSMSYATLSRHPEVSDEVDRGMERTTAGQVHVIDPAIAEAMNVTLMDPSMVVNSFYDPRQSKTARRFFQKQKLLQQMQNNQLHRHHPHHHHRHSRHSSGHSINNAHSYRSHSSHSPITEEALLNASTSTKAKVSNVNIHVEMGAYDWHELQSRLSDNSWGKSGKQMLPQRKSENGNSRTEVTFPDESGINAREEQLESQPATNVRSTAKTDKGKRKRHVIYHQRIPKKSKLEDQPVGMAEMGTQVEDDVIRESQEASARRTPSVEKPVYVFVDKDYRERAISHLGSHDEAMKTLPTAKTKKVLDESMDEGAYQKRETSV